MDQLTEDLPFLVVYGGHVWKALLIASVAAVCGLGWFLRRRGARASQREALEKIERAGEGEVVIHGTLGGSGEGAGAVTLCAAGMGGEHAALSWRAGELWVDTDEGRVVLEGELRVAAGSRVAASRNGVPASIGDAHLEAARVNAPWLHRVSGFAGATTHTATADAVGPGDRVAVRGCMERTPSAEPSGYRDAEVTWVMRPCNTGKVIDIAACKPRAAMVRMVRLVLAIAMGIVALFSWGTMKALGERWNDSCRWGDARQLADEPLEITSSHACALAAAMPGARDEAIHGLYRLLEADRYRDERSVRRLAGVALLANGCERATSVLLEHARFEDAAQNARACGDVRGEYVALFAQGRFEDAARLHVPAEEGLVSLPNVPTLIAAERWSDAADRVHAHAEAARSERGATGAQHLRCLEQLLRAFGGDREAEGRLRAIDAETAGACTPMVAELASPDERRRLMRSSDAGGRMVRWLKWAAGMDPEVWELEYAEYLLAEPENYVSRRGGALSWLASSERGAWKDLDPRYRATLLRWYALAQVFDGEVEAAAATAREAVAAMPEHDLSPRFLRFLPAAVALYTSSTSSAGLDLDREYQSRPDEIDLYFPRLMLRGAKAPYERYGGDDYSAALAAAQQGDGRPLAAYMGHPYRRWSNGDILAVLPRVQTGREAIVRQLTWLAGFRYDLDYHLPTSLWQCAMHAMVRREALKMAGVPDEAARWDAIYRRFDSVLDDRRRLIALMLWED